MIRSVASVARVSRVAYGRDVAALPAWCWQHGDNRWDDPQVTRLGDAERRDLDAGRRKSNGLYRVLYTATSRVCAFREMLQGFRFSRAPITSAARTAVIEDSWDFPLGEGDGDAAAGPDTWGSVPLTRTQQWWIGDIDVPSPLPQVADIEHVSSVEHLRSAVLSSPLAARLRLDNLSIAHILGECRSLTRYLSRIVHEADLGGIRHRSQLGSDEEGSVNVALYELRSQPRTVRSEPVRPGEPSFEEALDQLKIRVVDSRGIPIL